MASGKKGQGSKIVVWIILVLLIVGLAGFGATNFGGTVRSIGSVGDTEIEVDRYARMLNQELRAVAAQTGQNMSLSEARQFGLDAAVLQRLIGAVAIEDEAARLGISVGDEEVRRQILSTPAFAGIDGNFDRETYEFTLEQNGLTPARYEETIRIETARSIVETAVAAGVAVPAAYAETIIGFLAEERDFSWLMLDESALEAPLPEPTEDDLRGYYDAHTDEFMLPETRAVTYAWLSPNALASEIEVDEDELRALYEARLDEYQVPERRLVERLVFASPEEAQAARAALDAGTTTFEQLVEERGLALEDVDLGDVTALDLGAAAEAVFSLQEPGIAGPADTDLGPALFRVNAILAARTTTFEDAAPELAEEAVADRARRLIADQIPGIEDLLAGGATLEDLAAETPMELGRIDWYEGLDEGIAAYAAFAEAAATTAPGDFPELTILEDGGVFALRVDEVRPARPEPFEEARDKVAEAWRIAQLTERLDEMAVAIKSRVEGGERLSAQGFPVTVETAIRRDAFIEGAPLGLVRAVFTLEPGQLLVQSGDGRALVVQLDGVHAPDPSDPELVALRGAVSGDVAQSLSRDTLAAYTRAVQARAGISINQAALNAVHAQFP